MATTDTVCSIAPYFKVHTDQLAAFRALCERFVARTEPDTRCLYYGFSFEGDEVHCREAYDDADALLAHIETVSDLIAEAMELADMTRVEIHGPEQELARLRKPLADLAPQYFTLEYGFRRDAGAG